MARDVGKCKLHFLEHVRYMFRTCNSIVYLIRSTYATCHAFPLYLFPPQMLWNSRHATANVIPEEQSKATDSKSSGRLSLHLGIE